MNGLKNIFKMSEIFIKGEKVRYIKNDGTYENGMVKSIPLHTNFQVYVVYYCNDDWGNINKYTGQLTNKKDLKKGWE